MHEMQYSFTIKAPDDNSMTERLLRIIRVRGFVVNKMTADNVDAFMSYHFMVTGERSITGLIRQLEKVIGVRLCVADLFQNKPG